MENNIELSIIIPTVGRTAELKRLAATLLPLPSSCELIVVDQNTDNRINEIFHGIDFKHLIIPARGLSFARNAALPFCHGKWTFILDDDCWLSSKCIENILLALKTLSENYGIIINARAPSDGKSLLPKLLPEAWDLSKRNKLDSLTIPSISIVYPGKLLKSIRFSQLLGIGSPFGAAEEADMLIRMVVRGAVFKYFPQIKIFHAEVDYQAMGAKKSYLYAQGFGALCNFHNFHFLIWMKALRSLAGAFLFSLKNPPLAKNYLFAFFGRANGYLLAFFYRNRYFKSE